MAAIPDAGDIVWMQFSPTEKHEQHGHRPALVLSPTAYNRIGLAVVCPMTGKVKGGPFEVAAPGGVVLTNHVRSLDWRARRAKVKGAVSPAVLAEVRGKLAALVGIE